MGLGRESERSKTKISARSRPSRIFAIRRLCLHSRVCNDLKFSVESKSGESLARGPQRKGTDRLMKNEQVLERQLEITLKSRLFMPMNINSGPRHSQTGSLFGGALGHSRHGCSILKDFYQPPVSSCTFRF